MKKDSFRSVYTYLPFSNPLQSTACMYHSMKSLLQAPAATLLAIYSTNTLTQKNESGIFILRRLAQVCMDCMPLDEYWVYIVAHIDPIFALCIHTLLLHNVCTHTIVITAIIHTTSSSSRNNALIENFYIIDYYIIHRTNWRFVQLRGWGA